MLDYLLAADPCAPAATLHLLTARRDLGNRACQAILAHPNLSEDIPLGIAAPRTARHLHDALTTPGATAERRAHILAHTPMTAVWRCVRIFDDLTRDELKTARQRDPGAGPTATALSQRTAPRAARHDLHALISGHGLVDGPDVLRGALVAADRHGIPMTTLAGPTTKNRDLRNAASALITAREENPDLTVVQHLIITIPALRAGHENAWLNALAATNSPEIALAALASPRSGGVLVRAVLANPHLPNSAREVAITRAWAGWEAPAPATDDVRTRRAAFQAAATTTPAFAASLAKDMPWALNPTNPHLSAADLGRYLDALTSPGSTSWAGPGLSASVAAHPNATDAQRVAALNAAATDSSYAPRLGPAAIRVDTLLAAQMIADATLRARFGANPAYLGPTRAALALPLRGGVDILGSPTLERYRPDLGTDTARAAHAHPAWRSTPDFAQAFLALGAALDVDLGELITVAGGVSD